MSRNNAWGIWAGAALIVMGLLFMLGQVFRLNIMGFIWPLFILAVGALFFIGMSTGGRGAGALAVPGSVIATIGLILFIQNLFNIWSTWTYAWALIIAGAGVGLVIFGSWSQLPDLRRAGRVVISIGLVLFFVFGVFFELLASLLGHGSLGGIFWAVMLILLGVYVLLGRTRLRGWLESGPVSRSVVDFDQPGAQVYPGNASASGAVVDALDTGAISGIRRVQFHALGDMTILQGEREGLEIEASQAVRERIRTEVRGDTLEIRYEHDWLDWLQPRFWNLSNPLRFTLYVRGLDQLEAAGMGNMTVPALSAGVFELAHSGAGNVAIRQLSAEAVTVRQGGLGNVEIEGRVDRQDVELTGTGSYQAGRLESREARVHLSGLGSAVVWVREMLDARISGTGNVEYYGSPRVAQTVSGLGNVRRLGER